MNKHPFITDGEHSDPGAVDLGSDFHHQDSGLHGTCSEAGNHILAELARR